jgi:predicted  nucleic acid-binding Zn-ribbon protein
MGDVISAAIGESFLGRVFDSYQNMMQIACCLREAARQRTIERPLVLELSRRSTGLADYIPEAQITNFPTHEDNRPRLTDPVSLPFADKSFDSCLITDVYEHIAPELRPALLREMLRVTDGLVLVGSPQGNEVVPAFDRVVFDFIWGKYAERFEPLEQHMKFGLEPIEQTLAVLEAQGADRALALPCNYIYRWIHQILIYFDLQHRHSHAELFEPLNRIYNERLSPYDYREPCYRYLVVVATHPDISLDELGNRLKAPKETPAAVAEADGVLVKTFRAVEATLSDRLASSSMEVDLLVEDKNTAIQEIARLNAAIRKLQQDEEKAKSEIGFLRSTIQSLQDSLQRDDVGAKSEIGFLRSTIQSLQDSLQRDDVRTKSEIAFLRSTIQSLQDSLQQDEERAKSEIGILRSTIQSLKDSLQQDEDRAKSEIGFLRSTVQRLQDEQQRSEESATREIDQLRSTVQRLEDELQQGQERAKGEIERFRSALQRLHKMLDATCSAFMMKISGPDENSSV